MTRSHLLPFVAFAASCTSTDATDARQPWKTTFSIVGDTVVAATTGEVPDSLLRRLVVEWRVTGDSTGEFGDVGSMAVSPDGSVWVFDDATPALFRVDSTGASIQRVSRRGSGPGEYQPRVNDLAVARDGALVMWDEGNSRINIYNADGSYRTSAAVTLRDCCGLPVQVDSQNRIWLTMHPRFLDGKEKGVNPDDMKMPWITGYFVYDSLGAVLDTVLAPILRGVDPVLNAIQVSRTSIGGRTRSVPYGTHVSYALSPFGHVVAALSRPYEVHTQANGKHLRVTRDFTPVPVGEDERSQLRANIEVGMRQVMPEWTWNGPEIPREKPPINALMVGLDGRIWVQLNVPSEDYDPGPGTGQSSDFSPTRVVPPPVRFRPVEKRWDVFEPDGRYLGRIRVPREVSLFVARGNHAWGIVRDDDDVPTVVRLRIDPAM